MLPQVSNVTTSFEMVSVANQVITDTCTSKLCLVVKPENSCALFLLFYLEITLEQLMSIV